MCHLWHGCQKFAVPGIEQYIIEDSVSIIEYNLKGPYLYYHCVVNTVRIRNSNPWTRLFFAFKRINYASSYVQTATLEMLVCTHVGIHQFKIKNRIRNIMQCLLIESCLLILMNLNVTLNSYKCKRACMNERINKQI